MPVRLQNTDRIVLLACVATKVNQQYQSRCKHRTVTLAGVAPKVNQQLQSSHKHRTVTLAGLALELNQQCQYGYKTHRGNEKVLLPDHKRRIAQCVATARSPVEGVARGEAGTLILARLRGANAQGCPPPRQDLRQDFGHDQLQDHGVPPLPGKI